MVTSQMSSGLSIQLVFTSSPSKCTAIIPNSPMSVLMLLLGLHRPELKYATRQRKEKKKREDDAVERQQAVQVRIAIQERTMRLQEKRAHTHALNEKWQERTLSAAATSERAHK
jgi:hypothetical protein